MTEITGSGLAARGTALDLLTDVLGRKRALDDALVARRELDELDTRDRAFARLLAATTLRRLGQIDAVIASFVSKPLAREDLPLTNLLRLGLCQILFLGTPAHAAVDTSVRLAAARRAMARFKGLVNAVLRRAAREGAAQVAVQDAARLNTPDWLWRSWEAVYGTATTQAIAAAHANEPPLDVTAKSEPERWAAALGAEILPTGTLRLGETTAVHELAGYADGAWWVQDAGAALPAHLLERGLGGLAGRRIADLCAAPGGKAAQLAAAGARIVAVDRSAARLKRVRENLSRLGLAAEIAEADVVRWTPGETFDAVLLDAPCSATGTIRRHPDLPWLKQPNDVARLAELQAELLAACERLLAPGGLLVYCVCSLQPEEGTGQIDAFLELHPAFRRMAVRPDDVFGLGEMVTNTGDLTTLPCHLGLAGGIDGFYAARLVKREVG